MDISAKTVFYNLDIAYEEFSGNVTDAVFIGCYCGGVTDDVTFTRCTFIDCIDADDLHRVDEVIIAHKAVYINLTKGE